MPERKQIYDDEWVYPILSDFQFECCDCGLVHSMDFEILSRSELRFRVRREDGETDEVRSK